MSFTDTPDFMENANQRDSARPRFYVKPIQNNFRSDQEGRPVHDDVEHVEILVPGDRLNQIDRPVKAIDRERWPKEYAAFKAGLESPTTGTALSEWPAISRAQAEDLRFFHVRTVEDLAALSDEQAKKAIPMGGYELREKAKRFLESAAGSAPMEALAAENRALKDKMEGQEQTIEDLKAAVGALQAQAAAAPTPAT